MNDDILKPKNQTFEDRKKAEKVFIPELHSAPELMSYSEKLELAEEIHSELLRPLLEAQGVEGSVEDVQGSEIKFRLEEGSVELASELMSVVKEATGGIFSLEVLFN